MDHVVYLDAKAKEMESLLAGEKTMVIRGAAGRKLPYGRVEKGDRLYFINNNGEGMVKARAVVKSVFNSEKMTGEAAAALIGKNQEKLRLTKEQLARWAGKRYLVLIEVEEVEEIESFTIDRSNYGKMDDWLLVEKIELAKGAK